MLRKSILIGCFVLNNNRTGQPKYLQGGYERQLSSHALFTASKRNYNVGVGFCTYSQLVVGVNGFN